MSNEPLQWYPGHMAKADRLIREKLGLIDTVIEVLDARACFGSRNPSISDYTKNKRHIIVLNKADLADESETDKWIEKLSTEEGIDAVVKFNALDKSKAHTLIEHLIKQTDNKREKCLVVGIPNVGKSAIINALLSSKKAKTGNKPGVTKSQQWLKTEDNVWLLDTPGILWPRFDDQQAASHLAWLGSISDKRFEIENAAGDVLAFAAKNYPELVKKHYGIEFEDEAVWEIFEKIAASRNFLQKGGEYDYRRTSELILNDLRSGKLGRMTLERADQYK